VQKSTKKKAPTVQGLNLEEILDFSCRTFRENVWLILLVWGAAWLLSVGEQRVMNLITPIPAAHHVAHSHVTRHVHDFRITGVSIARSLAFILLTLLWGTFSNVGLFKISLTITSGAKVAWADVRSAYRCFLRFFILGALLWLILSAGLTLLVVPGVIWAIRYSLAPFAVIDGVLSPIAALKASRAMTKRAWWTLFSLGVLFIVLIAALALVTRFFLRGTVATILSTAVWSLILAPFFYIAGARVYHLLADPESKAW
jgi:uncharacterized membrane protein